MLSFVVPAYNEERLLPATLAAIHRAAGGLGLAYEIVVADDASTDATARIAESGGARVVGVDHRQIARTRNAGARAARGDRLVFVDADTRVSPEALAAAVAALDAGAVGGGATVRFDAAPPWADRLIEATIALMRAMGWAAGCFVFARRDAFEAAGGFDERHFAGEEIMLSVALKRRGRFVILREAVTTSGRKFADRSFAETMGLIFRLGVRGMSGVRSREATMFWYDGKR